MTVPTILIPGISGTKLVNTNTLNFDTIWSVVQSKYESIYDLKLKQDSRFEENQNSIIERCDVEDISYREAVFVLERKMNKIGPIYIFGYDWRKSAVDNAKRLADYIDYLKQKLSVNSFNFVVHSMGGIVFSCYLKRLQGNYNIIERAVYVACPFEGSVRALVALTTGEGGIQFPLFNSNDKFRKIARTFPSVFEMCPTYKDAVVFENGSEFDLFNPDHWQSNIGDDDIKMFLTRITQLKTFRDKANPGMLNLKELPLEVQRKFLIIAGEGEETKNRVIVQPRSPDRRAKNYFNFDSPNSIGGDGTVPLESSTIYKDVILTLAVKKKWNNIAMHPLILNDGRVQSLITRFLLNNTSGFSVGSPWWSVLDGSIRQLK